MESGTARAPRLATARKRAKRAILTARQLLKKYGNKVDPAHKAEVQEALEALVQADRDKSLVRIYEALKQLDEVVDRRLGGVRKGATMEYLESVAWAVGIAVILRLFIVEAFTIPSGSMIPTLAVGDFLFVNKLSYGVRVPFANKMAAEWDLPGRGDVVVFVYPCDESLDYIKRVIGLPGDVIDVYDGFVMVNGERVAEEKRGAFAGMDQFRGNEMDGFPPALRPSSNAYDVKLDAQMFNTLHRSTARQPTGTPVPALDWRESYSTNRCPPVPGEIAPPARYRVPDGHVFVMGDNRDNSQDSRYWGFVPVGNIKGKAMFIWLSWDGSRSFSRPWEKIRWGRLFHGVHAQTLPEVKP